MPKSGLRRPVLIFSLTFALAMFTQTIEALKASPAVSRVSEFKLDNGLQVIVVPDHRAPVVMTVEYVVVPRHYYSALTFTRVEPDLVGVGLDLGSYYLILGCTHILRLLLVFIYIDAALL